ncbi:MAG: hypothetical protein ACXW28_06905 [Thermoanaerobaculia bacterium]
MYKLRQLGYREMMTVRTDIRALFQNEPTTLGEASQRVVDYFRSQFTDGDGHSAFALARVFKTHPYHSLDAELRTFADAMLPAGESAPANMRCLILMATSGDEPAWNSRHASAGHKAIPLTSVKMVEEAPMIAQLIRQLGIDISTVVRPDPKLLLDHGDKDNVFYIEKAAGSPYIVAQKDFVEPHGIQSVIGLGGMMATGDLFATILFSRVPITSEVADLFKVIGLNLRVVFLPLARQPLF